MLYTKINGIVLREKDINYWKSRKQYLKKYNDKDFYILTTKDENIVKLENVINFEKLKKI